jgi:hypothetical protein
LPNFPMNSIPLTVIPLTLFSLCSLRLFFCFSTLKSQSKVSE